MDRETPARRATSFWVAPREFCPSSVPSNRLSVKVVFSWLSKRIDRITQLFSIVKQLLIGQPEPEATFSLRNLSIRFDYLNMNGEQGMGVTYKRKLVWRSQFRFSRPSSYL